MKVRDVMAADAERAGNVEKSAQYNNAAATIAGQLVQVEKDVESLRDWISEELGR